MAVAFKEKSQSSTWNRYTITVPKPTTLAVGDLMIGQIGAQIILNTTLIPPDGFTLIRSDVDGTIYHKSYYKVATSADVAASSFVWTHDGVGENNYSVGAISTFTGYKVGDPIGNSDGALTYFIDEHWYTSYRGFNNTEDSLLIILGYCNSSQDLYDHYYIGDSYLDYPSVPTFTEGYDFYVTCSLNYPHTAMASAVRTTTGATRGMIDVNPDWWIGDSAGIQIIEIKGDPNSSSSSLSSSSSSYIDNWSSSSSSYIENWSSSSSKSNSSSSYIENWSSSSSQSSSSSSYVENWSSSSISSESGEDYCSVYPPEQNDTYVKALYTDTYQPYYATDPTKSLTGTAIANSWVTDYTSQWRKLNIDLGNDYIIRRIYYENWHNSGGSTQYGMKNFVFYGTNSPTAFANISYADTTDLTALTSGAFEQHVASDVSDPKYIVISNNVAFRYYVFRFADNYGGSEAMALRRVELQETCNISSSTSYIENWSSSSSNSTPSSQSLSSSSTSSSKSLSSASTGSSQSESSESTPSSQSESSESTPSSQSLSSASSDSSASTDSSDSSLSSVEYSTSSSLTSQSESLSSSTSGVYDFTFDRYQTINETTNMGKDHFITLYSAKTTGKTASDRVFWGDTGVGDMTFKHYVGLNINGTIYYTPVYTGAPTVSCASELTGPIEGEI